MRRPVIKFECDICGNLYYAVPNPFSSKEEYPKGWVHIDCHYTTEGKYISHCVSGQLEAEKKNKGVTRKKYLDICPACWCNKVPQWLDPGITPNERYGKED